MEWGEKEKREEFRKMKEKGFSRTYEEFVRYYVPIWEAQETRERAETVDELREAKEKIDKVIDLLYKENRELYPFLQRAISIEMERLKEDLRDPKMWLEEKKIWKEVEKNLEKRKKELAVKQGKEKKMRNAFLDLKS